METPVDFSIIIPCFNEEKTIGVLLSSLTTSSDPLFSPRKIAVFSSACEDRTEEVVKDFQQRASLPIELQTESVRRGKCHAINCLLDMVGSVDIVVMISGDVLISADRIVRLLESFRNGRVGVAGGRPVPKTEGKDPMSRVSRVMWEVHHLMASQQPKTTEVTAFRNRGFRLDERSLVDEAEIEAWLTEQGYAIRYRPDVEIFMRPPRTMVDYLAQRIRVTCGHMALQRRRGHRVGSLSMGVRLRALARHLVTTGADRTALAMMVILEVLVWVAAFVRVHAKNEPRGLWPRISSAKGRL